MNSARAFLCWMAAASLPLFAAAHHRHDVADDDLDGPLFKAGGLQFNLPGGWIAETPAVSVRAGQWRIPALPSSSAGGDGEVVVYYFGPGLGGSAQENLDGWRDTLRDADGHSATGGVKTRQSGGYRISELVVSGNYSDPTPIAGLPPIVRPGYALAGAVLENHRGNLYWRLTGPAALVNATLPVFRRVLDSVKAQPGG